MTPKKEEYMRGYSDGFKDAKLGETGMVLGTGRERPLSIGLHTDGYPEARFESASLHQGSNLCPSEIIETADNRLYRIVADKGAHFDCIEVRLRSGSFIDSRKDARPMLILKARIIRSLGYDN